MYDDKEDGERTMEADWLIEEARRGTQRIAQGEMFEHLVATRHPGMLGWVHQLAHMSRDFIQALLMRAALCGRRRSSDYAFYPAFCEHARAEARHPIELEAWMRRFGL